VPRSASSTGRIVREISITMQIAEMAPRPKLRRKPNGKSKRLSKLVLTVSAEKITVRPAVVIVRSSASRTFCPLELNSSRKRLMIRK
jgi:hypothetical protein